PRFPHRPPAEDSFSGGDAPLLEPRSGTDGVRLHPPIGGGIEILCPKSASTGLLELDPLKETHLPMKFLPLLLASTLCAPAAVLYREDFTHEGGGGEVPTGTVGWNSYYGTTAADIP